MTVIKQDQSAPSVETTGALDQKVDMCSAPYGIASADIKRRMVTQLRKAPLSSRGLLSRPLAEAVARLAGFAPGPLDLSYVCNSGDEALDFSLKLARGTHPDRSVMVGLSGDDHGALLHGRSLTIGEQIWPGQALAPRTIPSQRADLLLDLIGPDVAAVVISPVGPGRSLTTLGDRWWRDLRERCWDSGALLIGDERVSAPARLGHPLGFGALGITPDVLVLGGQLSGGLVPVGAAVTSYEAYRRVFGHRNGTVHGSTFGANPMASTAIASVLDAANVAELAAWSTRRGTLWEQCWAPLRICPLVRAVAVDGLYASMTLASEDAACAAQERLGRLGVLAARPGSGQNLTFSPPLTIDDGELESAALLVAGTILELESSGEIEGKR